MSQKFRVGQAVMPTKANPYGSRYKRGAKVTQISALSSKYIGVNGSWWAAEFWKPKSRAGS